MKHTPTVTGLSAEGHHLHAPRRTNSASVVRRRARNDRLRAWNPQDAKGNYLHAWMSKDRECERRLRQIERGILKV